MKIALGCDHAGYVLKDTVVKFLESHNLEILDMGAYEYNKEDDYKMTTLTRLLKLPAQL